MHLRRTARKGIIALGLGLSMLVTPALSGIISPTTAQADMIPLPSRTPQASLSLSHVSPYFRSRARRMQGIDSSKSSFPPYIHFKAGMQRAIPGWTPAGYEAYTQGVGLTGMANMWIGEPGIANGIETLDFAVFSGNLDKFTDGLGIDCSVQGRGWMGSFYHGATYGQKGKRMEAIKMKLSGKLAQKYDIWYRTHCQTYGWMAWAKNGAAAGTYGQSKRMEAIQVVVLKKGSKAPSKNFDGAKQTYGKAYVKK